MSLRMRVIALCWLAIVFDGYDLIVYGATLPSLLAEPSWHLSPVEAGHIGSWALGGMLVGALTVGFVTDLFGRRRIIIACAAFFSVMMGLCAVAPSPEAFGVLRFLAGVGLGGMMPSASALTLEYAEPARRNVTYALMFTGYSVGGILAATLALEVIPNAGWRWMFAIGLAPLVLVVPLCLRYLPESPAYLVARGVVPQPAVAAQAHARATVRSLFASSTIVATLLFWGATFLGLLLVYGLNTWLPQIMRKAGYGLGSALTFLIVLNAGAIVGTVLAARVADRRGIKIVATGAFLAATASIAALAGQPSTSLIYALVAVAGLGTIGTQILVNAFVGSYYPAATRATALGWSLGVGRIGAILGPTLGGYLVSADVGVDTNFYVFAAAGLLGSVLISLVPRRRAAVDFVDPAPVMAEAALGR